MKIPLVEISNFLTIGHAKLSLDDKGLVLVQGTNLDDKSALSNGAGKSSIPDAICWGLYGVTARGVSADDVVNETAGKDCEVHLQIDEDEKTRYAITRYRKGTGSVKNGTVVMQYTHDAAAGGWTSTVLTKGTDRETQLVINTIMGCDYDVFTSSVYAAQEMMPNLPGMTDKNLKTLIESASGTEKLSLAHDKAKAELLAVNAKLTAAVADVDRKEGTLAELVAELPDIEVQLGIFESSREATIAEHHRKAKDYADKANLIAKDLLTITLRNSISDRIDMLKLQISEHGKFAVTLKALQSEGVKVLSTAVLSRAKVADAEKHATRCEKEVVEVELMIGKPCSECGKPYHGEDLADVKILKVKKHKESILAVLAAREVADKWDAMELSHNKAIDDYTLKIPDISLLVNEERKLVASLNEQLTAEKESLGLRSAERAELENAMNKKAEANPYIAIKERTQDKISKLGVLISDAKVLLSKAAEEVEIAKSTAQVFSPAGVRARILDTVTPFLNARTSDYLSALSDGNISAVWTTIQRNKAGELREKFGIDVTNDKGAKMFAGLSGGEKRKVRLSCALALQDLVSSRATKPISLMIADEIDDALDAAGLERLMGILEEKTRSGAGTVLVISHNSLEDWIPNILNITKEGGVSTISGACNE